MTETLTIKVSTEAMIEKRPTEPKTSAAFDTFFVRFSAFFVLGCGKQKSSAIALMRCRNNPRVPFPYHFESNATISFQGSLKVQILLSSSNMN